MNNTLVFNFDPQAKPMTLHYKRQEAGRSALFEIEKPIVFKNNKQILNKLKDGKQPEALLNCGLKFMFNYIAEEINDEVEALRE